MPTFSSNCAADMRPEQRLVALAKLSWKELQKLPRATQVEVARYKSKNSKRGGK